MNAVAAHVPFIEDAREKVTGEMQAMVLTGLATLVSAHPLLSSLCPVLCFFAPDWPFYGTSYPQNRPLLSTSLQTASNLRVLPSLVQNLVLDLSEAVEERIKSAFDISKIGKDVISKGMYLLLQAI